MMQSAEGALPPSQPNHTPAGERSFESRELLLTFRKQLHAVGALWILFGMMAILVGAYVLFGKPEWMNVNGDVAILVGCLWLVVGVYTCRREMWALTGGWVLSYALMALGIARGRASPGVLFLLANFQGHRVRGFARKLAAEGIAPTTKP